MPDERPSHSSPSASRQGHSGQPRAQRRPVTGFNHGTRQRWEQRAGSHASHRRGSKPFDRRELLAAGGGALVVGGIAIGGAVLALRPGVDPSPASVAASSTATAVPTADDIAVATPPTAQPTPTPSVRRDGEEALVETSLADLQGYILRREVTVSDLVNAAERRIARLDAEYGAVIEMNPEAMSIAQELDAELDRGEPRGPLHGIPVLLKDIVATGDEMRTTAGALALAENDVAEDATIVKRLREAGAVILGKANLTEWSNVRAGGQTAGWSDRGGQTRNPYDPAMSTWGSSSGSAAAVALSYAPLTIGAETNGSIICPAAACGVVGLKPTVGLVSRTGVMPVSWTLDSPGPMARSVADIAGIMNVIAGYDAEDPAYGEMGWTSPAATTGGDPVPEYGAVDYTASLDPDALNGARLGICWQLWGMDPEADLVAEEVIQRLREAGAEVIDGVTIPTLGEVAATAGLWTVINTEFAAGMQAFFDRYMPDAPVNSIQEVVNWNIEHADEVLDMVGQGGLTEAIDAMSIEDPVYQDAVATMISMAREQGMDAALDDNEIDAIIAPTAPVPTEITIGGGTDFAGSSSEAAAHAGYPSITVPMGYVRGLPVGLHLSGRAFSEQRLIAIAYSIEQLLQVRVPPEV